MGTFSRRIVTAVETGPLRGDPQPASADRGEARSPRTLDPPSPLSGSREAPVSMPRQSAARSKPHCPRRVFGKRLHPDGHRLRVGLGVLVKTVVERCQRTTRASNSRSAFIQTSPRESSNAGTTTKDGSPCATVKTALAGCEPGAPGRRPRESKQSRRCAHPQVPGVVLEDVVRDARMLSLPES